MKQFSIVFLVIAFGFPMRASAFVYGSPDSEPPSIQELWDNEESKDSLREIDFSNIKKLQKKIDEIGLSIEKPNVETSLDEWEAFDWTAPFEKDFTFINSSCSFEIERPSFIIGRQPIKKLKSKQTTFDMDIKKTFDDWDAFIEKHQLFFWDDDINDSQENEDWQVVWNTTIKF